MKIKDPYVIKKKGKYKRGNVEIEIVRQEPEFCQLSSLLINGQEACLYDFGYMKDVEPQKATTSGCGKKVFIPSNKVSLIIIEELGLTEKDIPDLISLLSDVLFVGNCPRCRFLK